MPWDARPARGIADLRPKESLPGSAGVVYADWADARRAKRYRVFKKVTGVDNDFHSVASVTDSDATMIGLPSRATVEIQITAVNDAGESQRLVSTVAGG